MSKGLYRNAQYGILPLIIILSLTLYVQPVSATQTSLFQEWSKNGPYVDKLLIQLLYGDGQIQALLDNEIDIIANTLDPEIISELQDSENIRIESILRNGYGYMSINTAKYPFNITAFRRAVAFALDKDAISREVWENWSEPLDSIVAKCNPFSIEGELPYSYYAADPLQGNSLLEAAGFTINASTGFRGAPDGRAVHVDIDVAQSSNIAIQVGEFVHAALESLHINATLNVVDFYEYLNRCYFHGDYDMVFLGTSQNTFDVDWLAYEYWSEYADEPYRNFPNFRNATYDLWREQLLHSTQYDEVFQASAEMQRIIAYESPIIVCYENMLNYAYREDSFENIIATAQEGIASWWTTYNARLSNVNGGPLGGTLRLSHSGHAKFNPFQTCSCYGSFVDDIPWDTLLRSNPSGEIIPWLAESYVINTNEDNSLVPEDITRFTFNLVQNATWSDGYPITAEDVAYTMNFYRDCNPAGFGTYLSSMTAAYTPAPWTVILEFEVVSYWHISKFTNLLILPKHIFSASDFNISYWNPNPNSGPMVTSGPFNYSSHEFGEFIELTRNPNYFYGIDRGSSPLIESTNITEPFLYIESASLAITAGSLVVAVGVIVLWKKEV